MNQVKAIIAIDCGISNGGIVLWAAGHTRAVRMPRKVSEIGEFLSYVKETYSEVLCFVEAVSSYRGDTDTPGKRFGIDKLLANYESVKTALTLTGIPYAKVYPQSWQNGLNLKHKDDTDQERKNRYKAAAQKYYPEIKATLWNSDALCILHFGRFKLNTDPKWVMDRLPPAAAEKLF